MKNPFASLFRRVAPASGRLSFSSLFRSVIEWFRPAHRISREQPLTPEQFRRASQSRAREQAVNAVIMNASPQPPPSLSPEEFRRMLEEALAADPNLARRFLRPLAGTVFPIQGGTPGTQDFIAKFGSGESATVDSVMKEVGLKIGLGTTGPSKKLTIDADENTTGFTPGQTIAGATDVLALGQSSTNYSTGGTIPWIGNGNAFLYFNSAQQLRIGAGTGATPYLTIVGNTGNVGIGTASPQEKLDVAGNILSQGLNKIVFLKPLGGTQDDQPQIQSAINALPANGGIIMLLPGTYRIGSTITINKTGIKLRGYGGSEDASGQLGATTRLLWTGATDINKRVVEMISTVPDNQIGDVGISDLLIDCDNKAGTGLFLDRVIRSRFVGLYVRDANPSGGIGIKLTTAATMGSDINSAWNLFENCSVFECSRCLVLDREPNAHGNSSHNQFVGLTLHYRGDTDDDAGIWMGDCDNNTFYRVWLWQIGTRGQGVLVTSPHIARANCFYHLQTVPNTATSFGFRVKNATLPFNDTFKNLIFGYDLSNGNGEPTSDQNDVQNFVFWINSRGQIKGQTP